MTIALQLTGMTSEPIRTIIYWQKVRNVSTAFAVVLREILSSFSFFIILLEKGTSRAQKCLVAHRFYASLRCRLQTMCNGKRETFGPFWPWVTTQFRRSFFSRHLSSFLPFSFPSQNISSLHFSRFVCIPPERRRKNMPFLIQLTRAHTCVFFV